ncbi:SusD/RagB family nutrient-binding outer membrane lipoprotein [Zhouia sp. PK063]|uniref:SusD/RagB family nutrient-binding outer membrane lipoprotein n=1 Tax=Zhouia sp. PK063 TaxID=3373602 RepID=UPI0037981B47
MKKRNFHISLLLFASLFSFTACDTVDFGDANVNTNLPNSPIAASLFTNSERSVGDFIGATTPNMYVQYLSNGQYAEESLYADLNWSYNGWYAVLNDLQKIIQLNTDESTKVTAQAGGSNANQIASATILKVYLLHGMTDRWGYLPYTNALQGLDNIYPSYDSQETIYNGLFDELDYALSIIDDDEGPQGDYILGGDMNAWKTFANTIKMVMALRLSKAAPALGETKFKEALGNAISSNAGNLYYPYVDSDSNDNPWQDRFETRKDYLISDSFADALIGSGDGTTPEDPRLPKMSDPAINNGLFVGAPYGNQNSTTDDYSFITGDIIYTSKAPLYIYTYSEVLFARAEAAALGWTNENEATLYSQAIKASMDQWGVDDVDATTYIAAHPYVDLSSIGYEKWVSLFLQGYESWAEYRRMLAMGYEKELTAPNNLLGGATGIPNRQAYSSTAKDLNEDNYNAAISEQGTDDLNTILWIFK